MKRLKFMALFDGKDWLEPAYVCLDSFGIIQSVDLKPVDDSLMYETIDGYAISGFQNAHSHAFQYAMAGLAEHLSSGVSHDDFWTWRNLMYKLAQRVTPEQMENIAAMAYAEMLRAGYTAVSEFHYLHHDCNGISYNDPAEMAHRLIAAAERSGIHLTLIPILYQKGGFGIPPLESQKRFISKTIDQFSKLYFATRDAAKSRHDVHVGLGIHSLRAVDSENIKHALQIDRNAVTHMHIAEQKKEVLECENYLGARPISWLLDHVPVNEHFALVHATHSTNDELKKLAASKASVVICPSTEANLGDGLFQLQLYRSYQGRVAIGSDSHIGLNALEELRWLDYGQRLNMLSRNVFCKPGQDSGTISFCEAWQEGRKAMGFAHDSQESSFGKGSPFDAVIIDSNHPLVIGKPSNRRLSTIIYAGDLSLFLGVMRRGAWLIRDGCHSRKDEIIRSYRKTMHELLE